MWIKTTLSLLLVIGLSGCADNQTAPQNHTATISTSAESRYQALRLTPEIYSAAKGDLSNLRIVDSSGDEVPYFINSEQSSSNSYNEVYDMELINSYLKDDMFYFDYALASISLPDSDIIATSLEFATSNDSFAKELNVYGSYDNIHWDYVQSDTLYSINGVSKLEIEFFKPQKFTYYRIELSNNLEQISFTSVTLVYNVETSEESFFIETLKPSYSVESSNKSTVIIVEGLQQLRLCDITIHSNSTFRRYATAGQYDTKEIYNLPFNGETYSDTTIPVHWTISDEESFVVTISDGDDRPITIDGITVRYYADDLVFESIAGQNYTLTISQISTTATPMYDIERYKSEILAGEIARATITSIQYAPEDIAPVQDYRAIFNMVMIAVTILLATITTLKLRKK
jgi:hypothetical protein